jgi:hypothetical protein
MSHTHRREARIQCHCGHYREIVGDCLNPRCLFFQGRRDSRCECGEQLNEHGYDHFGFLHNHDLAASIMVNGVKLPRYQGGGVL